MSTNSNSQYYTAYAAIVKITLRDGMVSEEENEFLKHLSAKLHIRLDEYQDIMENYTYQEIVAPYTYNERLKSLYELTKIIHEDTTIIGEKQAKWLQRIGTAIGFNPSNVKYITAKGLDLIKEEADVEAFSNGIRGINK
ncbi:TerB family tellurite resistance protein [uncultured Dokdonia sp.]|uniref:TerB family tellurite resistance protein n=1 Tax=uncultured Dokdonia sp. TaxID=575653 RepID=UPI002613D9B8|nr:TerB family tellurite resistance protein [uncultured Dokdonia sp.]